MRVYDPRSRQTLEVQYTELELRKTIAGTIARGVNASCSIEGEGLEVPIQVDPWSVPESLLTTP